MYNDFGLLERLLIHWNEVEAEFNFQMQQAALRRNIEQALAKPSPPYQPTPRGCGLVEDKLCENMNK